MERRGFSLLEVLVALAVLLAITGIALPSLLGRVSGVRLDTGVRQFGAVVVSVRAAAQERGAAIELVALLRGDSEELATRELRGGSVEEPGDGPTASVQAVLPTGLRLSMEPPPALGADAFDIPAAEPIAAVEESRRLAVFMPDGSVVAKGPVYLSGYGQDFELTLNRWTGGVSSREMVRSEGVAADPMLPVTDPALDDAGVRP